MDLQNWIAGLVGYFRLIQLHVASAVVHDFEATAMFFMVPNLTLFETIALCLYGHQHIEATASSTIANGMHSPVLWPSTFPVLSVRMLSTVPQS